MPHQSYRPHPPRSSSRFFSCPAKSSYRTSHAGGLSARQPNSRNWPADYPNIHGMSGLSPHEMPRHGLTKPPRLPHAFGLNARLRAFSCGYRVVPITNRNGQPPKSSKSAAPASAVARRVGDYWFPKDTTSLIRSAKHYIPLGRRPWRTTSAIADYHAALPGKSQPRASGHIRPGRLKLQTSEVTPVPSPAADSAPPHPPSSAPHRRLLLQPPPKVSHTARRWLFPSGQPPASLPEGQPHCAVWEF